FGCLASALNLNILRLFGMGHGEGLRLRIGGKNAAQRMRQKDRLETGFPGEFEMNLQPLVSRPTKVAGSDDPSGFNPKRTNVRRRSNARRRVGCASDQSKTTIFFSKV